MTLPEIPPAHRDEVAAHITEHLRLLHAQVAPAFTEATAYAAIAALVKLGWTPPAPAPVAATP